MLVALEGLPGSGKTTSAYLLARRLTAATVCETTHDHPFLETVYDDTRRYDLQVELAFLLLHNAGYRQIDRNTLTIADFSPVKDLIFADAMLSGRERDLFDALYHELYERYLPPEVVVYLDAAPELCLGRVRKRLEADESRKFEAGMDLDRLRLIQEIYEAKMSDLGNSVVRLSVDDQPAEEIIDDLLSLIAVHLPPTS